MSTVLFLEAHQQEHKKEKKTTAIYFDQNHISSELNISNAI